MGVWRIRDRSTFSELRRRGRRGKAEHMSCLYLPSTDDVPPRVAYAIGKRVGPAVVRNRVRRRLRSAINCLEAQGGLPGGAYLLRVHTGADKATYETLAGQVEALVSSLATEREPEP